MTFKPFCRGCRRRAGYTLLEMAIAASILGLVSVAAAPNLVRTAEDLRFRQSAQEVVGILKTIRAEAITGQRSMQVALNGGAGQFHVGWDRNGNGTVESGEWGAVATRIPSGYITTSMLPVGRFNSRGMFHVNGGYWEIQMTGPREQQRYVYVFPSGHITLAEEALP